MIDSPVLFLSARADVNFIICTGKSKTPDVVIVSLAITRITAERRAGDGSLC